MIQIKDRHILIIPKWYPNHNDLQNGIFVKKHASSISLYNKVSVLYICSSNKIQDNFKIEENNNNFHEVIIYFKKKNKLQNILNYWKAFKIGLKYINKIDIILPTVITRSLLLAYYIKRKQNVPFLLIEHWTGYINGDYLKFSYLKRKLIQFLLSKSEGIICVSNSLKTWIQQHIKHNNYYIVPNVFDRTIDLKNVISNKSDKVIILSVADLDEKYKNITSCIDAIYELSKHRSDFEYHIIGGGIDELMLKQHSKKLNLYNRVVFFHGRQDNNYVLDYLPNANFVLINSYYETFSVLTIEALSNGKPVLSTKCGGPEELIDDNSGKLFDLGNQELLISSIDWMLNNFNSFDPNKIKNSVIDKYSLETIGNMFNDIFNKTLNNLSDNQ